MKQTVKTSRAAGQLEKMFRELNKHYFAGKLPEPIISLKKTRPPMVISPVRRSGRQAARTSMRSIFHRLPLTVPLKRPHPPCCMRWCMSTAWRPVSRTPATTGSTTTGALRSRQQSTRQQSDRCTETSQGKEQHPAVGMSQVRYYHPEHQGRAGHLCGLHGAVREG